MSSVGGQLVTVALGVVVLMAVTVFVRVEVVEIVLIVRIVMVRPTFERRVDVVVDDT